MGTTMSNDKVYGGGFGWVSVEQGYRDAPKPLSDLKVMLLGAVIMSSAGSLLTLALILVVR